MNLAPYLANPDIRARLYHSFGPEDENGCWPWLLCPSRGYAQFFIQRAKPKVMAHRVIYELMIGPIPNGLELDHLCRNPMCVNPAHLEPVTGRENQRRGIGFIAKNMAKTHCIRGHEFSPENTKYIDGARSCRECNRIRALEQHYRNRDAILARRRARRAAGKRN